MIPQINIYKKSSKSAHSIENSPNKSHDNQPQINKLKRITTHRIMRKKTRINSLNKN